jgi:hypothetical protein
MLDDPRALSDLDPQPPPLLPLNADDPLLFSCPPQPLEAAELELELLYLFELPFVFCQPLPVFL